MRFNVFLPRSAWCFLGPTLVFTASVGPAEECPEEPFLAEPAMSLRGVPVPRWQPPPSSGPPRALPA